MNPSKKMYLFLLFDFLYSMIHFLLIVNKDGQTRLSHYTRWIPINERSTLEGEAVRKCLRRTEYECSFVDYKDMKLVYRRYASLYFIVGVDKEENELAILEMIHAIVETFEKYFENVCELDIMYNVEKAHFIVQEMIAAGTLVEANKQNILYPMELLENSKKR